MNLGTKVKILPLSVDGRVVSELRDKDGTMFKVRYFWNGEAKEVFFFIDELESVETQIQQYIGIKT